MAATCNSINFEFYLTEQLNRSVRSYVEFWDPDWCHFKCQWDHREGPQAGVGVLQPVLRSTFQGEESSVPSLGYCLFPQNLEAFDHWSLSNCIFSYFSFVFSIIICSVYLLLIHSYMGWSHFQTGKRKKAQLDLITSV